MRWIVRSLAITISLAVAVVVVSYWSGRQPQRDAVEAARQALGIELRSSMIPTNGIRLHVVEAGPTDGPPVILLHGYPEFWWAWREQMAELARAGFHVIVPDQRGYNASDKPAGVEAYRLETLALDIVGLIDHFGYKQVNLTGHDWGGVVAWNVAIEHGDRVRKLVMFNMGHPLAFEEASRTAPEQKTISWYRTFFQLPWVPELVGRFGNWGLLAQNLRDTSRPGTFSDDALDQYRSAWDRDGAMHTMVNWYRAGFRYPRTVPGDGIVRAPTTIVWGMRETFMESRLATLSAKYCTEARVIELPEASHWLLHEEPEVTSRAMIEFFGPT